MFQKGGVRLERARAEKVPNNRKKKGKKKEGLR